jgi:uncharacterized protein
MVPLLAGVLSFRQHVAHATSLAAIVVIALSGAVGFGVAGQLDLGMAAFLLVGGLLGAYLGARSMHHVSERTLRLVFGGLLVAVGVRMVVG